MYKGLLNPEKALIFRIVHQENVAAILGNGCHCRSCQNAQKYVEIGNPELIDKRTSREVPLQSRGNIERLCAVLFHAIFAYALQY